MQGGLHASSSSTPLSFSPTSDAFVPAQTQTQTWNLEPGTLLEFVGLSVSVRRPTILPILTPPPRPSSSSLSPPGLCHPVSLSTSFFQPCLVASLFDLAVELWPPLTLLVLPLPRRPFQPRPRRSRRHLVRSSIFEPSAASFPPLRSFSPSTASCRRCCCCQP